MIRPTAEDLNHLNTVTGTLERSESQRERATATRLRAVLTASEAVRGADLAAAVEAVTAEDLDSLRAYARANLAGKRDFMQAADLIEELRK